MTRDGSGGGSRSTGRRVARLGWLAALTLGACGPTPPARECLLRVWARPVYAGAEISVIGTWDDWAAPIELSPDPEEEGWWRAVIEDLPPGDHGYLVVEDGVARVDPYNPLTRFASPGGELQEVSLAVIPDCSAPAWSIESLEPTPGGARGVARFLAADGGAALDPDSIELDYGRGDARVRSTDPATGRVEFELAYDAATRGKHSVQLVARDLDGAATAPARAAIWEQAEAEAWRDELIYHVMIDRFRGDGGAALAPPPDPGARAGGTLDGLRVELERGTFTEMGVSTLWLSPVYRNPEVARQGRDDEHLYEGYHGYWVLDSRGVDPRLGGEAALERLVAAAHERGIRVLLDLVPNHVYEDNPRYQAPPGPGWFNAPGPGGPCVCGTMTCPWDQYILTCWFTDYLPDLRFENPGVMREAVDDALWWDRRFDVDGARIDAVFMMPRGATRWIAHALREDEWSRAPDITLGEAFTGPGGDAIDALRYYLGPDGLDSVFDFPLMWAVRDAVAHDVPAGFEALEDTIAASELALAGSGSLLSGIIGNHDTTRFVSEIVGDAEGDPWSEPPAQPSAPEVYARQRVALALLLTLPGVPVLYYGDELGLAGGRDPDCRRVMPEIPGSLDAARLELLASVRRLGRLRRCSPALRRGARRSVLVEEDVYAFLRDATGEGGGAALVVVSRADAPTQVSLPAGALAAGVYVDVVSGEPLDLSVGGAPPPWELPALGVAVLVPAGDPCASP